MPRITRPVAPLAFALSGLLFFTMLLSAPHAQAQFASPTVDGTINAGEYGVHTDGQNQQTTGATTWYMTWDDTNLYVGLANANTGEAAILYIDKDAALPALSGVSGNAVGQIYDGTRIANLPFLADFVVYFKNSYREFRTGAGWGTQVVGGGSYAESGGNTRELSIPWSAITGGGRPAAFNFLAYVTTPGGFVYGQVPGSGNPSNPSGGIGLGATYPRFYSVLSTVDGASTKPFSRNTVEQNVGGGGYTTLKAAFDAINAGSPTGTVNLYVAGNTTETASAILVASGAGPASYASVTIRPSGGSWTVSSLLGAALIDLYGADNVTIDGRIGGTGATKSLTFENLNATGAAATVQFRNDATANTIRYTSLKGSNPAACANTPTGVIYFGANNATGNDNNTLDNNDIGPAGANLPATAICAYGAAAQPNDNITISNNNIFDFWATNVPTIGIWLVSVGGSNLWTIQGNSFYQTAARTGGTQPQYAVFIGVPAGSFTVSGNTIGGSGPGAIGSPWTASITRFAGIYANGGGSPANSIQGNTIANLAVTVAGGGSPTDPGFAGIWVPVAANIGTVTANTVGSGAAANNIQVTGTGSLTYTCGICATAGAQDIRNNVVGGINAAGSVATNAASVVGIYAGASATSVNLQGNAVGSTAAANSLNAAGAATVASPQFVYGIQTATPGSTTITGNTVANLNNNSAAANGAARGIAIDQGQTVNVLDNLVRNITSAAPNVACDASAGLSGIWFAASSATTVRIAGNTVHSLAETTPTAPACVSGILYSGSNSLTQAISRNFIHSLTLSTTNTAHNLGRPGIAGMYVVQGTNLTLDNNLVRVGLDAAGNSITTPYGMAGIYLAQDGPLVSASLYHNTIYLGGAGVAAATNVTAALYEKSTVNGVRSHMDNLLVNARSNASGSAPHLAAYYNSVASTTNLTSDYNLFYALGAGGALVQRGGTNYTTTTAWTAASGKDANSTTGDPVLVNPTGAAAFVDLHVDTSGSVSPAANAGTPAGGVTTDFDNQARNAAYPDIGADEFTDTGPLPAGTYARRAVNAGETWTLAGDVTLTAGLGLNGGLLDAGSSTLTLGTGALVVGTPSVATMIIADGGGQVCKQFSGAGPFTFPIGDNTGTPEYSPATLNFTAGTFAAGAQACLKVTDAAHPAVDAANFPSYLTRHWTATQTGITAFTAAASFIYTDADLVIGGGQTESALALWKYDAPNWTLLNPTNAANNTLSGAVTSFSDFTARSVSPLAVALADFHGALVDGRPVLTWATVSEQDHAGFNLYRSETENGPWVKANDALIASAAPGSAEGHAYTWTDAGAAPAAAYWYLLEDVALSGQTTQHGPVRVGPDAPTAVNVGQFTAQLDWPALIRSLLGLK